MGLLYLYDERGGGNSTPGLDWLTQLLQLDDSGPADEVAAMTYSAAIRRVAHLIVGSSPTHLVLGIHLLARSSGDVVIAEAADRPGGAWRVGEVFGIPNLELGCHHIPNHGVAYAVLERCGVALPPMNPRPIVLVARPTGARVPDFIKNSALSSYGLIRRNHAFDFAVHDARIRTLRTLTRTSPEVWRYPTLGCAGLVSGLTRRFTDLGGQLLLECGVTALRPLRDRVDCALGDGSAIVASHAHVTPNSAGIHLEGLTGVERRLRTNVLMAVASESLPFSVGQVKGDPVITAVSNIGRFADTPAGMTVVAVQLRNPATAGRHPDLARIVEHRLRRLKLLRKTDAVIGVHLEHHTVGSRGTAAAWMKAAGASSRITVRHVMELIHSFAEFSETPDQRIAA